MKTPSPIPPRRRRGRLLAGTLAAFLVLGGSLAGTAPAFAVEPIPVGAGATPEASTAPETPVAPEASTAPETPVATEAPAEAAPAAPEAPSEPEGQVVADAPAAAAAPSAAPEPAATVADPRLSVTPSAEVDAGIENTFTVTGSGYVGAGARFGAYILLGETGIWSGEGPLNPGGWLAQAWVMPNTIVDGAFTTTITIPAGGFDPAKSYTVASSAAHGLSMTDRSLDAFASIEIAQPTPAPVPTVTVSKTSQLDASGETVTVTGTGFTPDAPTTNGVRPPLAGRFAGAYVVFGSFLDEWRPSAGAPSSARVVDAQKWVVEAADVATIGGAAAGAVAIDADGSFELELTVREFEKALAAGHYGIASYAGSGAKIAAFETFTPIEFGTPPAPEPTPTPTPTPIPTPEPEPAPAPGTGVAVASGSLSWGVSSAFRSYITGNVAHGAIAVGSGATQSGGAFQFGQSGGSFSSAAGTGTADYAGSVRFTGHGGALDLTFANPTLRVTDATSGMLDVTVNGARVALASVDLGSAARSTVDGAARFAGAPVTLTAAGSRAFEGFYGAGASLDSLTAVIGSPGAAPAGSSGTVASASRAAAVTQAAPAAAAIAAGPEQCTVSGATLEWGFKSRFLQYLEGGIANGDWTVTAAEDRDGVFAFSGGTGSVDAAAVRGVVAFPGSIAFSGHGGALDTTIANPQLELVDADTATLLLDVTGTTQDGTPVSTQGVRFAELDLTGAVEHDGDRLVGTAVPAVLTEQGAAAFGTYGAGEELDALTFVITLPAECGVEAAPAQVASDAVDSEQRAETAAAVGPDAWLPWVIAGVAALALIAGVVALVIVLRRRRSA